MERSNLICWLQGWFTAKEPNISAVDLKIKLDNSLIESGITPLGTEPNDLEIMRELLAETMIHVMGRGINRETRRKGGIVKSKEMNL